VACPFFMPTDKSEESAWLHPGRLPLGGVWQGVCTAGEEVVTPDGQQLNDYCSLGYATACPHLPRRRAADAVRFSIANDCSGRIQIRYTFELAHHPGEHGTLEYDAVSCRWMKAHPDGRVQKMAECHLESYLSKKRAGQTVGSASL
jgi:hypothetical protein